MSTTGERTEQFSLNESPAAVWAASLHEQIRAHGAGCLEKGYDGAVGRPGRADPRHGAAGARLPGRHDALPRRLQLVHGTGRGCPPETTPRNPAAPVPLPPLQSAAQAPARRVQSIPRRLSARRHPFTSTALFTGPIRRLPGSHYWQGIPGRHEALGLQGRPRIPRRIALAQTIGFHWWLPSLFNVIQDPGKVWKGKKMAGRMGGKTCTQQNLQVVKIDTVDNLIYVKGAVPGVDNAYVKITDAVRKGWYGKAFPQGQSPPFPTFTGTPTARELLPVQV